MIKEFLFASKWKYTTAIFLLNVMTNSSGQSIRLQGPLSSNGTGRVEVYHNGRWGTICDDNWDINYAQVVCHQLGYPNALSLGNGYIYPGSGKIWLDSVNCTGSEHELSSCSHSSWGWNDCSHGEDVGVQCAQKGKIIILPVFIFITKSS